MGAPVRRSPPVHRIIYADDPISALPPKLLRYLYGTDLLVISAERSGAPVQVPGVVLHNDPSEDPKDFVGDSNPALLEPKLPFYGDKWEEVRFLRSVAPDLAPDTFLASDLLAGEKIAAGDFERLEAMLRRRFGRYVLKTRAGFGSEGHIPTDRHDLPALWRSFQAEFVPRRAEVRRTIHDPDALNEHLNEHVPFAEGQVLEALAADPASVLIQPYFEHDNELRVHVVRGRLLEGATTARWTMFGWWLTGADRCAAESAVLRMLERAPPISFGADVLIDRSTGHGRCKIVDLNPGLESGMYQPENDLFTANLLAERFLGRKTPYLMDLFLFDRAPLEEKPIRAKRMNAMLGEFVTAHETCGFYDKLVDGWVREVRRRPRADIALECWRQMQAVEGMDAFELCRFLYEDAVRPFIAGLPKGEVESAMTAQKRYAPDRART